MVITVNESYNPDLSNKSLFDIELEAMNVCHEFDMYIMLSRHASLLEGEGQKAPTGEKIRKFIEVMKEKIKDFFIKISQKIIEISTKITSYMNEKNIKNIKDYYDQDEYGDIVDYAYNKMKTEGYCCMPYPNELTKELGKGSYKSTVDDYLKSYKYTDYEKDQIEGIVRNTLDAPSQSIRQDLNDCKKWRDEALKDMANSFKGGELIGDIDEQTQRYNNMCKRIMVVYMANLKGYLHNTKFRSDIIKYAVSKSHK